MISPLSKNKISRRALFRALLNKQGIDKSNQPIRHISRPPFACDENIFSSLCNGCGECVKACPYGLIQLNEKDKTAIFQIDFSSCDFCTQCAKVCSLNILNTAFKADTELRPQINSSCLQKNNQSCTTCTQACPQKAISETLQIDYNKCNGCGECKVVCFMNAIEMKI